MLNHIRGKAKMYATYSVRYLVFVKGLYTINYRINLRVEIYAVNEDKEEDVKNSGQIIR